MFCIIFESNKVAMEKSNNSKKQKWHRVFTNKYLIASLLFMAWIIFFDENSFMVHKKNKERLNELNAQKEYYIERIATDRKKLKELNAGREQLEKFAREQYFMSKPGEDVFIVIEEE
jgi:cell division protein DivIC